MWGWLTGETPNDLLCYTESRGQRSPSSKRHVEKQERRRRGLTGQLSKKSQAIGLSNPGDSRTTPGGALSFELRL